MENPLGQSLRELPGPLLLTGHTGFKGTWMTFLLEHLNVPVVGYSLPPEKDSLYDRAERTGAIPETFEDIRDYEALEKFIDVHKPSTIIHMAAQPLVLRSYESPRETFDINVTGTANLLDIAFKKNFVKAIIVVTTDKVYKNDNSGRAFVETDSLEGKDPYSASKVGTEAVVAAWQQISKVSGGPKIVSVRAGNVIGGGDYASDRIFPDLIRSIVSQKPIVVRNPISSRPWQHVLDVTVGYIQVLDYAINDGHIENLNFGPTGQDLTVGEILVFAQDVFQDIEIEIESAGDSRYSMEAVKLALDATLAVKLLNWQPRISQEEAIISTLNWWKTCLKFQGDVSTLCTQDIKKYLKFLNEID